VHQSAHRQMTVKGWGVGPVIAAGWRRESWVGASR
jgi:hypothetical protein